MSLTKNHTPNEKNLFQVQTRRLAASFKLLTRLVALIRPDKFPRKPTCTSVFFSRKSPKATRHQKAKKWKIGDTIVKYLHKRNTKAVAEVKSVPQQVVGKLGRKAKQNNH